MRCINLSPSLSLPTWEAGHRTIARGITRKGRHMNRELADKIAKATLYEGYILYPYRPSVKNQQRWTFGGIYPRSWSESGNGTDLHTMQTEVLVAGKGDSSLHVIIRFLHLVDRTVGEMPDEYSRSLNCSMLAARDIGPGRRRLSVKWMLEIYMWAI